MNTGPLEFTVFFLLNGQLLVPSPSCIALKRCEGLRLVLWPLWAVAAIFEILTSVF